MAFWYGGGPTTGCTWRWFRRRGLLVTPWASAETFLCDVAFGKVGLWLDEKERKPPAVRDVWCIYNIMMIRYVEYDCET